MWCWKTWRWTEQEIETEDEVERVEKVDEVDEVDEAEWRKRGRGGRGERRGVDYYCEIINVYNYF